MSGSISNQFTRTSNYLVLLSLLVIVSCKSDAPLTSDDQKSDQAAIRTFGYNSLIPMPYSMTSTNSIFDLTPGVSIYIAQGSSELHSIAEHLAREIRSMTSKNIAVVPTSEAPPKGNILLAIKTGMHSSNEEAYSLNVTHEAVELSAGSPSGLFRGTQTIGQLITWILDSTTVSDTLWGLPGINILDHPRFAWRGAMLDVARHFFSVNDVKRFIDLMALYKLNRLHLHLSDDQGWRLEIKSRPNLTSIGGTTQVGGALGSFFYTQEQYTGIVTYAQSKYIMVIPEFDMPGHSTAALASYPELNCNGIAPKVYTGIQVGLPGVCVTKDTVYSFIDDVVKEIAALTPGPYIHIGGDESSETAGEYINFIDRVQPIIHSYGKTMIGWEEIGQGNLASSSIMQYWYKSVNMDAVQKGVKVILSPSKKIYLDMQYTPSTLLGQNWAGYIEVQKAYEWDPSTELPGVSENSIHGVEAPLWTEKVFTMADIEYMTFPRLIGLAEIGWSPATGRNWSEYSLRLADHGRSLSSKKVNFYRSPQVPWK